MIDLLAYCLGQMQITQKFVQGTVMPTYRVPVLIKGLAVAKVGEGTSAGDDVGGLRRDAKARVGANTPYLCRAQMADFGVELNAQAKQFEGA